MKYLNNAAIIKRELMVRLARLFFKDQHRSHINQIPYQQIPKDSASVRCCIHHDRAVVKNRLMALLGFSMEEQTPEDESRQLDTYLDEAIERGSSRLEGNVLTVIDEACSSCVRANYRVTDACRGCVARLCIMNCPKKAIKIVDGRAVIDEKLCVSCGICEKACPYHSIIYQPIPCEESCPVGAISQDERGKEKIDDEKCIYCGKCMMACPFGAIMERSELFDILRSLTSKSKTVAMVAPAIIGQFNTDFEKIVTALKKLGFDAVVEVAYGADLTAAAETEELRERFDSGAVRMTSSCCPAYVSAVEKHLEPLKGIISHTPSPMIFTAKWAAKEYPDAMKVFIGPCVAKRIEARKSQEVDHVMTFEELGSLFVAKDIDVLECEPSKPDREASNAGRGFAISGGVAEAIKNAMAASGKEINLKCFDGIDKKTVPVLKMAEKTVPENSFIEVMTCSGGCMNGPGVISNPIVGTRLLKKALEKK
jgi:[FeFe] hydrogenase (group B1/B3)